MFLYFFHSPQKLPSSEWGSKVEAVKRVVLGLQIAVLLLTLLPLAANDARRIIFWHSRERCLLTFGGSLIGSTLMSWNCVCVHCLILSSLHPCPGRIMTSPRKCWLFVCDLIKSYIRYLLFLISVRSEGDLTRSRFIFHCEHWTLVIRVWCPLASSTDTHFEGAIYYRLALNH